VSKAGYRVASQAETAALSLSSLSQADTAARLQQLNAAANQVILLGGVSQKALIMSAKANIDGSVSAAKPIFIASDFMAQQAARSAMTRGNVWLKARAVKAQNAYIATGALFAATLATESLMHVDDKFSREYCVEKLEHNLENMPPMTAYERLSIGPKQRFASKQVHMHVWPGQELVAAPALPKNK
jgi:hypothetical protein